MAEAGIVIPASSVQLSGWAGGGSLPPQAASISAAMQPHESRLRLMTIVAFILSPTV
jgi:hypothetical protein